MSEVLRASLETTKLTFLLFSAQVNEFKFAKNGGRRREKGRVGEEEAERLGAAAAEAETSLGAGESQSGPKGKEAKSKACSVS